MKKKVILTSVLFLILIFTIITILSTRESKMSVYKDYVKTNISTSTNQQIKVEDIDFYLEGHTIKEFKLDMEEVANLNGGSNFYGKLHSNITNQNDYEFKGYKEIDKKGNFLYIDSNDSLIKINTDIIFQSDTLLSDVINDKNTKLTNSNYLINGKNINTIKFEFLKSEFDKYMKNPILSILNDDILKLSNDDIYIIEYHFYKNDKTLAGITIDFLSNHKNKSISFINNYSKESRFTLNLKFEYSNRHNAQSIKKPDNYKSYTRANIDIFSEIEHTNKDMFDIDKNIFINGEEFLLPFKYDIFKNGGYSFPKENEIIESKQYVEVQLYKENSQTGIFLEFINDTDGPLNIKDCLIYGITVKNYYSYDEEIVFPENLKPHTTFDEIIKKYGENYSKYSGSLYDTYTWFFDSYKIKISLSKENMVYEFGFSFNPSFK